jgi:hypothetical protein
MPVVNTVPTVANLPIPPKSPWVPSSSFEATLVVPFGLFGDGRNLPQGANAKPFDGYQFANRDRAWIGEIPSVPEERPEERP